LNAASRNATAPLAYAAAITLLFVKVALVVVGVRIGAHVWSSGFAYCVWLAGKIVPTLICMAFLIDAIQRPRSNGMRLFWTAMTVAVPFVTIAFVVYEAGRAR
jgi:hypothetical protein